MAIRVPKSVIDEMKAHAEETYPEECCGLLVGNAEARDIVNSVRMENTFSGAKNARYYIDPLRLFEADRSASQRGLSVLGVYHSHPDYPAHLSTFDLEHSFPWYSYIVISVEKGKVAATRCWSPGENGAGAEEESLEVLAGA